MFSIAICDDNEIQLEIEYDLITNYLVETKSMAKIKKYISAKDLLFDTQKFDIYLLDMVLPGEMDGISLGKKIKEQDANAKIIYITADNSKAVDAYEIQAFSYLVKPINMSKLTSTLDRVRECIRKECFIMQTNEGERRIHTNELLYIDISRRCLCYHLKDGNYIDGQCLRGSFENALGAIKENEDFIFLKPSLLINLSEIDLLNQDHLTFKNGQTIYFPKAKYQQIKDAWVFAK